MATKKTTTTKKPTARKTKVAVTPPPPVVETPPPAPVTVEAAPAAKAKKTRAKKVLDAVKPKAPEGDLPPTLSECQKQLKCLVHEYQDITGEIRRTKQRTNGYQMRETGEFRESPLNQEQKDLLNQRIQLAESHKSKVLRVMGKLMRSFPVYNEFLAHVPGVGDGCAALLLAAIDWNRCNKPSSLAQLCGMGMHRTDEGAKAQRLRAGQPADFHADIKAALWNSFAQSMVKAKDGRRVPVKGKDGKPVKDDAGNTVYATDEDGNEVREGGEDVRNSPYFRRMMDYKNRLLTSGRYDKEANAFDGRKGGAAIIHNMAYRPAAQLFLYHLYLWGRTLAGLPCRPLYNEVRRDFAHGDWHPIEDRYIVLTIDQVKALVAESNHVSPWAKQDA